ncbi:MAG: two-component system sensor histidine kinase/response regulator, partial [Comamonadaceae bacterium]
MTPTTPTSATDPAGFRRILSRNVALPLGLGLVSALLFVALLAYVLEAMRWVEHTDRVLARAYAVQKMDLELESSVRGFLLGGDERYLENFQRYRTQLRPDLEQLKRDVADNPLQLQRLDRIERYQAEWDLIADERINARRTDPNYNPATRAGRGKQLKDSVRDEFDAFAATERALRQERTETANRNTWITMAAFVTFMLSVGGLLAWRGRMDLLSLSGTFESALSEQQRQGAILAAQAWLREGQSQLSERLSTEQEVAGVGHAALESLSGYLGSVVGALYLQP